MSLIEFLDHAELQIEADEQRTELTKAVNDISELPIERLSENLYADYEGKSGQWSAAKILTAYFYSSKALSFSDSSFLRELEESEVRIAINKLVKMLTEKCFYHPGRGSKGIKFGKNLCQTCLSSINTAVGQVDKHVVPKDCFVVYTGGDNWAPIGGTGCAHWVAHQLGIDRGNNCADGKTLRVPDLIDGLGTYTRENAAVNDIWANDDESHCGLVVKVEASSGSAPNRITIRHDSSAQGGVRDNDFDSYFKASGSFNR